MTTNFTEGLFRLKFNALGTRCEIQFRTASVEAAKEFRKESLGWLREFENRWSRFKPDSFLSQINNQAGLSPLPLGQEDETILALCDHVYRLSNGLNDPTSFPLTKLWDEASQRNQIPDDAAIEATRSLVSWPAVEWKDGHVFLPNPGMALEIGGFGKEYAVDQIIAFAKRAGIVHCLVDLGRDVATLGQPPHGEIWVVGIENARVEDAAAHRLALSGKGLATSGNGRRFREIAGEKFGHLIDPRNGRPAKNDILTVSCLADDCLTAGLFSTTACLLDPVDGMALIENLHGVEALVQSTTQTLHSSKIHYYVLAA